MATAHANGSTETALAAIGGVCAGSDYAPHFADSGTVTPNIARSAGWGRGLGSQRACVCVCVVRDAWLHSAKDSALAINMGALPGRNPPPPPSRRHAAPAVPLIRRRQLRARASSDLGFRIPWRKETGPERHIAVSPINSP